MADGKTGIERNEMIVRRIAGAYRRSRARIALREQRRLVSEDDDMYESDRCLVDTIDGVLQECSEDARKVIEKVFFPLEADDLPEKWQTQEEREKARQSAIEEFMRCLNM